MDGDAHQEKHAHISCGLIFLFASSRGAGRFIWKDGNEGGKALVRLQFLFPITLLTEREVLGQTPC